MSSATSLFREAYTNPAVLTSNDTTRSSLSVQTERETFTSPVIFQLDQCATDVENLIKSLNQRLAPLERYALSQSLTERAARKFSGQSLNTELTQLSQSIDRAKLLHEGLVSRRKDLQFVLGEEQRARNLYNKALEMHSANEAAGADQRYLEESIQVTMVYKQNLNDAIARRITISEDAIKWSQRVRTVEREERQIAEAKRRRDEQSLDRQLIESREKYVREMRESIPQATKLAVQRRRADITGHKYESMLHTIERAGDGSSSQQLPSELRAEVLRDLGRR